MRSIWKAVIRPEMRIYELGFHLDGELPQEESKRSYQAVRDGIAAAGTVITEGEPTKIPLAYTIFYPEYDRPARL